MHPRFMSTLINLTRRGLFRWLVPGLRVKRWLLLMVFGVVGLGLGLGYFLVEWYRDSSVSPIFYYLTLQFLPRWVRAVLFVGAGVGLFSLAFYRLNRSLVTAAAGDDTEPLVEKIWAQRIATHGPKIVAIGGGHGLAALLSGIKHHTRNITAIVTVADDGGSSGRLRREFGVLPPGDFRMCISALADDESIVTQLMQYRFSSGDGLSGHSFGNLFIAALAQITGSFEKAIEESSRVVASRGRIIPSTLSDVVLCAEYRDAPGEQTRGESSIGRHGMTIERVWLDPQDPPVYPDAVKAILGADLVVIGPGSIWTSLMPNLLVPGLVEALKHTQAPVVYAANITTERGETDRFDLDDHLDALERHVGPGVVDHVLVNANTATGFNPPSGVEILSPVVRRPRPGMKFVFADVVRKSEPWRHDPSKLAGSILEIFRSGSPSA
jgi:uncharacterized cofD-like protein